MKKNAFTICCIMLVLSLLLVSTGSVSAAPMADGPSIYSSTDETVTTTTLEISGLPGTVKLDNGAIYPIGHENGDLLFSGVGLKVSGLSGSAVIHMPVKNYTYGWTGSIYQYAFGGWIEVPTIITKDNESNNGTAAATIYYDGIYVVLVHYVAPPVVEKDEGPSCPAYESVLYYAIDPDNQRIELWGMMVQGDLTSLGLTSWVAIPYSITSDNPAIIFSGATSGPAELILMESGDAVTGFAAIMSFFEWGTPIVDYTGEGLPYFTITVDTGACNFSFTLNAENYDEGGGM